MKKEQLNIKNNIIYVLVAFFVVFAIFNVGRFSSSDIFIGSIFVLILMYMYEGGKGEPLGYKPPILRRTNIISAVVSLLWTCSYLIYSMERLSAGMENKLFIAVYVISSVIGIYAVFFFVIRKVILLFSKRRPDAVPPKKELRFSLSRWLIYSLVVLVLCLPLFILNYPGTMTVDSFEQLRQVRGMMGYADHHPWVHTMIIKALYDVSFGLMGDVYAGIAAYILFQMIVTALSVGYAAAVIDELGQKRIWSILIIVMYVIYPYHLAYATTIWKDILFSDMVLLMTVTIYRLIVFDKEKMPCRDIVLLAVSGLFMCMLRHNGLYAYILTMIIILSYFAAKGRKNKAGFGRHIIITTVIFVATLLVVFGIKGPAMKAYSVTKGDYAHNLAIPLQQIGRTVKYDGSIAESDIQSLEKINSIIYIKNNYEPGGADNMIQWLAAGNSKYFEEHKKDYLMLWMRVGLDNPVSYFRAYIDQTKGYYVTMMPEQIAYYGILPNEDGLETKAIAGATVRIKIDELCSKIQDMIPVYGIYYSMGATLLLLILLLAIEINRQNYRMLLGALPVLTLTATILIATPLVADLRYAYPLMLCFPTIVSFTLGKDS